jgi:hypothetical protein
MGGQPRGELRHRANSGIVEAALEADCAQSDKAVRYTDTEGQCPAPTDATCPPAV